MKIQKLELLTVDLEGQKDFYANVLELPAEMTSAGLLVKAGETELLFTQAPSDFKGAYHFAFNIPENRYQDAKEWLKSRTSLLQDNTGREDFHSRTWDSDSVYFLDAAGNVLEFIARHTLQNPAEGTFDSSQILRVSEIGLPSEDVLGLAEELTTRLGVSVYKQVADKNFTPLGDENGLLILPVRDRIWMPDSGVPARMLPVRVWGSSNGQEWEVRGVPYEINS